MTLYNRPQVCFTPELQPEWLIALICIFVGCICITTTIILLASSNWDRNVIPYARWVGFTASEYMGSRLPIGIKKPNIKFSPLSHCSGAVLSCGSHISTRIPCRRDRWPTVPSAPFAPGRHIVHHVRAGPVDHGHIGAVCGEGVPAAVLKARAAPGQLRRTYRCISTFMLY